jgi:Uma2 family endonuclease
VTNPPYDLAEKARLYARPLALLCKDVGWRDPRASTPIGRRAKMTSMAAPGALFPVQVPSSVEERRILLTNVPWSTYVVLRDSLDSPGVRMTYLEGLLEIMSPSREHEVDKTQISRLLELFCLERDIPLYGYGSTTFRKEEKQRGLEPDECYCRGEDRDVPDVALEVVVTHGAIDKLEVYRGLGVREVWVFEDGAFRVLALRRDGYERIPSSEAIPEVDLSQLARYAKGKDQHTALRAFRDELRERPARRPRRKPRRR